CRRVAGSIGRLCLAIFGASDQERAFRLADDLGVAMQLTNILRDVREDFDNGRVYLPREDLERFGCEEFPEGSPDAASALIAFEAARGREWFERGLELVPLLDTRSWSCASASRCPAGKRPGWPRAASWRRRHEGDRGGWRPGRHHGRAGPGRRS